MAVIRRHLKPVGQPHQRVLTPEQWQLVQPVYDDEGNLTDFHALAQKNFNLKDVTDEAYDRQHSVTADDTNDAALGPHNCSVGPDGSLKPMSAPRSSAQRSQRPRSQPSSPPPRLHTPPRPSLQPWASRAVPRAAGPTPPWAPLPPARAAARTRPPWRTVTALREAAAVAVPPLDPSCVGSALV